MSEKLSILIVDDNLDMCSNLRDLLDLDGHNTEVASDGQTALALCRARVFDLALVDINLPDISGMKLIEVLGKLSSGMEYIIITGRASLDTAAEAVMQKSIISYELKPLDMNRIRSFIKQVGERKQAEKAARESEEKYQAIFREAQDGIALVDSQTGNIVDCNPEFERQTGRSIGQMSEMKIWGVRSPEKMEAAKEKFLEVRNKERGASAELEFQRPDGEIVPIEFVSHDMTIGGRHYLLSMTRDITERKRAEQVLQESEAKYSTLIETARDGVVIIQDDVYKFVNNAFADMIGYRADELVGMPIADVTAPESRTLAVETHRRRIAGEEVPDVTEYKILCKDGTVKGVEVSAAVIQYQGKLASMSLIRDVTERRQAEEATPCLDDP